MNTSNFIICHRKYFETIKDRCASELLYFFKQQRKGWFIITIDELRSKFFGTWGRDSIRKALKLLADVGLVARRHTRLNGRAWEYQFVSEEPTTVVEDQATVVEDQATVVENQTTVVENQTTTYIQDPLFNPSLDPLPDPWLDQKEKKDTNIVEEEYVHVKSAGQKLLGKSELYTCDNETHFLPQECKPIPNQGKCSAASSQVPNKRTTDEKEVWEIAPSRPYPVFLNWWASTKYKPQGGHWAADAMGNAYAEFYNNRSKTAIAIFPQFLEYMSRVTENSSELLNAEFKALLPSCFVLKPESTQENVQRLMERVQSLVEKGVQVALPTDTATPSCSQSMSFEASKKVEILPFTEPQEPKQLTGNADHAPTTEEILLSHRKAWRCASLSLRGEIIEWASNTPGIILEFDGPNFAPTTEEALLTHQKAWCNAPLLRNKIVKWVNSTPGVTLGVDGPELEVNRGGAS